MADEQAMTQMVKRGLAALYQELAETGDVSTARRYRLEGQCALLLESGLIDWPSLQAYVEQQFQLALELDVSPLFWQWCLDEQYFRLPYQTPIAPVS